ncbi:hypothetical protein L208DRAFT_1077645, partial [Tricholoma matsutake]
VPDRYHESILYLRPKETRRIHYRILYNMLCFRRRAQLQCILVSFEGPKEMRGSPVCVLKIFHIVSFGGQTRGVHVHILEVFHIFWFWG